MKLTIVLEKSDNEWFGSCEAPNTFLSTAGKDADEVTQNILSLIEDHIQYEGATQSEWQGIGLEAISFEYQYDLSILFDRFKVLNVSEVAKMAGLNKSLLLQYKSGIKHASKKQAAKIEEVINQLGQDLLAVSVA